MTLCFCSLLGELLHGEGGGCFGVVEVLCTVELWSGVKSTQKHHKCG